MACAIHPTHPVHLVIFKVGGIEFVCESCPMLGF